MTTPSSSLIQRGPTLFLKITLIGIALAALAFCALLLYLVLSEDGVGAYAPILVGMTLTALPFLLGVYEAFKMLNFIDRNLAFTESTVRSLKKIKRYALIIGCMYMLGMPYIYYVAEIDDAPGVILIGMALVAAPIVVAVFAATLQKLLQNAIEIKSENDLTV